jgi:hypothetical protein
MADPSKMMHVTDEVLVCELLQENEGSDIEINVKILSCSEQSVSSDEEESVSDNSSLLSINCICAMYMANY